MRISGCLLLKLEDNAIAQLGLKQPPLMEKLGETKSISDLPIFILDTFNLKMV